MNRIVPAVALLALATPLATTASIASTRGDKWWADIARIAGDDTEGRLTGSPGYDLAARRVVERLKAIGLAPAGDNGGYYQQVAFEEQRVDQAASTAELIGTDGKATALRVGSDLLIGAGGARRPERIDAPLVFIGYGLSLPDQGHDDFAGIDLKCKIAVVIAGGPADIPGPVKASNRSSRARFLARAGAVGVITLTPPKQIEIPWERQRLLAGQPGMYLAGAAMRDTPDGLFSASVDPAASEALFAGSGHSFAELAALADASRPMPRFALPLRLRSTAVITRRQVTSPNLVARLEGSNPALAREHVVVSAHLDHLGIGAPIDGDRIYNGAMDDASGVASVLDIAEQLVKAPRPKRSILFLIVTAEEKGLLGSHYFARNPTVAKDGIVADLNFDMPLPLWPVTSVLVQGDHESTLGDVARSVGAQQGLRLVADPLPDRNSFVRTDQYSFVRAGVPALAFKNGFEKGTAAFQIEHDWRANRYHAPSDDLAQPGVLGDEAVKLDDYVAAIALAVANAPARPEWLATSVFRPHPQPR